MRLTADILIIGAGPAGSTAAISAAKQGLSAVVIERQKFPKDKICGDGVTLGIIDLLDELGIPKASILEHDACVFPPAIQMLRSANEKIRFDNTYFVTIRREVFDKTLRGHIPASVPTFEETTVSKIVRANNKYLVTAKGPEGELQIECDYLIGADGYSSYVKRHLFRNIEHEVRVASRYYTTCSSYDTQAFDFYFDDAVYPGYFWIFKVGPGQFNTGVYLDRNSDADIYELHDHCLRKYLKQPLRREGFHTWPIPNNKTLNNLAKDNALLTGDAAGLCDKLIGHGIDAAIASAHIAVSSIHYHLKRNEANYPIEEIYRYNLSKHLGPGLNESWDLYNHNHHNRSDFFRTLEQYLKQHATH